MDLLYSLLKVTSMIATGIFGALGLLTKYRDADGRITKWGKVALGGILISSAISLCVYTLETSRAKATAVKAKQDADATKQSLSDILDKAKTTAKTQEDNLATTQNLQSQMRDAQGLQDLNLKGTNLIARDMRSSIRAQRTLLTNQELSLRGTNKIATDMASSIVAQQTLLADNAHILDGISDSLGTQLDLLNQTREISLNVNRSLFPIEQFTTDFTFTIPVTHPIVGKYVDYLKNQARRLLPQVRESRLNVQPGKSIPPIEGLFIREVVPAAGGAPDFMIRLETGSPHFPSDEKVEGKLLNSKRMIVQVFKPPYDINAIKSGAFADLPDLQWDAWTFVNIPDDSLRLFINGGYLLESGYSIKPLNVKRTERLSSLLDFGGAVLVIVIPHGLDKAFELTELRLNQPRIGMCFKINTRLFERIDGNPLLPTDERDDTIFLQKLPEDFKLTACNAPQH